MRIEGNNSRQRGVFTLLFTDVVGSTALKQQLGDKQGVSVLQKHHALVRQILSEFTGAREIETAGDSFFIIFTAPSEAVKCALMLQAELRTLSRVCGAPVQDRMGLHLGEVVVEGTAPGGRHVHGMQVDICARVMTLAQAGQILMTRSVFDNARQSLKGEELEGVSALDWLNHGRFELKGITEPVEICEVQVSGSPSQAPPPSTEKARRIESAEGEAVLGWRPAIGLTVPNTNWVLEQKLGEGGFGEVWRARHGKLNEARVFKFCFRADRVRTLKREVTLFRVLKERIGEHPNIVRLYDIYFDQPPFYVQEEYVPGGDLKQWCEAHGGVGQVPLELRLEIVAQAADALQAAHDAGVIHRDVKPGNILLLNLPHTGESEARGTASLPDRVLAKLTDFGIGQVLSEEALKDVTRTGFTKTILGSEADSHTGTQLYMAPELWEGKPASTRSDIYALGVVLYQLLAGDFKKPVPPDWANEISEPLLLEDLHHCLAGKPADRFAGAGLLAKSLRALPQRRTELARQAAEKVALERAAYRRGVTWMASVAAAVLAVILVLGWQLRSNALAKFRHANRIRSTTVRLTVANGLSPATAGDWLSACLWFSEAFLLDETFRVDPDPRLSAQTHRLRLGLLLRQTPRLEQMWFEEPNILGCFDPAGQQVLLGGTNSGFALYHIQSGRKTSPAVGRMATCASLRPDGQRIVTAGGGPDSLFAVWDATSGDRAALLREPAGEGPFRSDCKDVQYSPDGRWIAAAIPEGRVVIWDAESACVSRVLAYSAVPSLRWTNAQSILAVRFDPTGERLVTTGTDRRAVVWEWRSGRVLNLLEGHRSWVYAACFGRQHTNWLVTCSFDRSACLWDLQTGERRLRVEHEGDGINDVTFSPDDRLFLTGGLDSSVRFWDSQTGRIQPPILRAHGRVMQVGWSADGRRVLAITWDGVARVWQLDPEGTLLRNTAADFSGDGRLALTENNGAVRVKDALTTRNVRVRQWPAVGLSDLSFAGGAERFFSLTRPTGPPREGATRIQLWDFAAQGQGTTNGNVTLDYDVSWSRLLCARDGERFAFWNAKRDTNGITVWEPSLPSGVRRISFPGERVDSAAFDPRSQRMAIGSRLLEEDTGVLRFLDLRSNQEPVVLLRGKQRFVHVIFSPDGQWLAASRSDPSLDPGDAVLWRVPEHGCALGEPSHLSHLDGVLNTAFSDNARMLVTGSEDQTAMVWRMVQGAWQPSLRPLRCGGQVYACAFSPNGRWLATADRTPESQQIGKWSSHVRIWDIVNSEPVSLPFDFPTNVTRLQFVAEDTRLFLEHWEPPAPPERWLLDLVVNESSPRECLLRAELLSAQRSFLTAGAQHLTQALEGKLSAEEALLHATGIGPLRPLSKEDCRELWLHVSPSLSSQAN